MVLPQIRHQVRFVAFPCRILPVGTAQDRGELMNDEVIYAIGFVLISGALIAVIYMLFQLLGRIVG